MFVIAFVIYTRKYKKIFISYYAKLVTLRMVRKMLD